MKNYTKKEAVRIITEAAKKYKENLCNYQFLIAYEDGERAGFSLTSFHAYNFKHLTGVISEDGAARFYRKALSGKLAEDDFSFDRHGNAQRKLAVLPVLHLLLYGGGMRGRFNRSGISIEANYFIGRVQLNVALAFRYDADGDYPVSLYCEDIRKLTVDTSKILAIWRCPYGSKEFENTYADKSVYPEDLLSRWMD